MSISSGDIGKGIMHGLDEDERDSQFKGFTITLILQQKVSCV